MAAPAVAQDAVTWPGQNGGFTMTLRPVGEGAHIASFDVRNQLTPMGTPETATLTLGPLNVGVVVAHRAGSEPDTVALRVPKGFVAIPATLDLQEGEAGTISIFILADMVMG